MEIISVGIDVGTSTTQIIFSQLSIKNTASYLSIPKVEILDKKVIYKSDIMITPLEGDILINGNAMRIMIENEYSKAGFVPNDIKTGAVIITGESALKENANIVIENLSNLAGEFVVSTAGPDLEAIIAGKGSGAYQYSIDHQCVVANVDIGGGTTNIVLFDGGEIISKGSLDIGGRLVKIDNNNIVSYISPKAKIIADYVGIDLNIGKATTSYDLYKLTNKMNDILEQYMGIIKFENFSHSLITSGSSIFEILKEIDFIFLTGGVSELIYDDASNNADNLFPYGDIGAFLGNSIKNGKLMNKVSQVKPSEIIRATVVGAGTYTTTISGSTIMYTKDIFPIKNVPVYALNNKTEEKCYMGDNEELIKEVIWFQEQIRSDDLILSLKGPQKISYINIKNMAKSIADALLKTTKTDKPIIVVIEKDIAKALGQAIDLYIDGKRNIVCIDNIKVANGDYVDMGKPMLNGIAIPIIVKTLIFR